VAIEGRIGNPCDMLELLTLLLAALRGSVRQRHDLVIENLLLRHQLAALTRSGRHPKLHSRDKLLWVLVRRLRAARRQLWRCRIR
jgi:hypothetical protein